ncbi:MAG TPA: hypothetical protein VGI32_16730, partial [Steroidobacteraceae bacterium]
MSSYVNPLTDYSPQLETGHMPQAWKSNTGDSVFREDEEDHLAAKLLDVSNEADLDRYVNGLIGQASRAAGAPIADPVQHDLGDIFKGVAKTLLPL